ncbi:hypothetical protein [Actinomadura sp. 9N407]|uniref:hypothetical protein n=1 Tax=Actinomadura sp. 9N407 TaxID=3375154 RepID=UPI0037A33D47
MRPTLARLAVVALVPVLALATACGDDGDKSGGAPPATPSSAATSPATSPAPSPVPKSGSGGERDASPSDLPTKSYNAFARCMRKQGVQVPDAGQSHTPPPEQNPAKAQRALKACAKLLSSATPSAG